MKRFYKEVSVTPDLGIALDGRSVKTPAKATLTLLNTSMAEAVADEWRAQKTDIDPHSMPFTGFANAAIDRIGADPQSFATGLAHYAETDLLCYRADNQPELLARQEAVWNPLLDWARARYDVSFTLVQGIMHQKQPAETVKRLSDSVMARAPFELAPLSPMVTITGSLVIALGVLEKAVEPLAAFDAAHLDELWQAELWGEDHFALETREHHRRDFLAACRFLDLVRG